MPSIAHEKAIILLVAGRPKLAPRYPERSDQSPLPWFKRALLDLQGIREGLKRPAASMIMGNATTMPATSDNAAPPTAKRLSTS